MIDLSVFPKNVTLRDGRRVTFRPLSPADQAAAREFVGRLPAEERIYLWDDPSDPKVFDSWAHPADPGRLISLTASEEGRITALWTLSFGEHGWTRHLGYIWGIVEPSLRRGGLGTVMVRELLALAGQLEMERVVLELVRPQKGPIAHFTNLGFKVAAVLKDWVKDHQGRYQDLMVLTMELEPAWRKMDELIARYDSHGA